MIGKGGVGSSCTCGCAPESSTQFCGQHTFLPPPHSHTHAFRCSVCSEIRFQHPARIPLPSATSKTVKSLLQKKLSDVVDCSTSRKLGHGGFFFSRFHSSCKGPLISSRMRLQPLTRQRRLSPTTSKTHCQRLNALCQGVFSRSGQSSSLSDRLRCEGITAFAMFHKHALPPVSRSQRFREPPAQ